MQERMIVHEIDDERKIFTSRSCFDMSNEKVIALSSTLVKTFRLKSRVTYGNLDPADGYFYAPLKNYEDSDENFIKLSSDLVKDLAEVIKSVGGARIGYIVFHLVEQDGKWKLNTFLVRNTNSVVFAKNTDTDSIDIEENFHLDTSKMSMALSVELNNIDSARSVEYIDTRKGDASDYFIEWLGVVEMESNKHYFDSFLQVVDQLPLPSSADGDSPWTRDKLKEEVSKLIKTNGLEVDLHMIARVVYGQDNEDAIAAFVQEKGLKIATRFKAINSYDKLLNIIDINGDGISLKGRSTKVKEQVELIDEEQGIVQIKSPDFYKALSKKL